MKITIKYDRKDFFGTCLYCEDYKNDVDLNDLKKAFSAMKKDNTWTWLELFKIASARIRKTVRWERRERTSSAK